MFCSAVTRQMYFAAQYPQDAGNTVSDTQTQAEQKFYSRCKYYLVRSVLSPPVVMLLGLR